jgi:hypothetical protein
MMQEEFVLSRDQRDKIMKAVSAIGRQLKEIDQKPRWQTYWVIGMNLTIIQTSLTNLPRTSSNWRMIGSAAIAATLALWGFWILLLAGLVRDDVGFKGVAAFVLLWIGGRLGLSFVPYEPAHSMFSSWVAALDIALVFMIFKGDVRLG